MDIATQSKKSIYYITNKDMDKEALRHMKALSYVMGEVMPLDDVQVCDGCNRIGYDNPCSDCEFAKQCEKDKSEQIQLNNSELCN